MFCILPSPTHSLGNEKLEGCPRDSLGNPWGIPRVYVRCFCKMLFRPSFSKSGSYTQGIPWGVPGRTLGIPWAYPGESLGIPWVFPGVSLGISWGFHRMYDISCLDKLENTPVCDWVEFASSELGDASCACSNNSAPRPNHIMCTWKHLDATQK